MTAEMAAACTQPRQWTNSQLVSMPSCGFEFSRLLRGELKFKQHWVVPTAADLWSHLLDFLTVFMPSSPSCRWPGGALAICVCNELQVCLAHLPSSPAAWVPALAIVSPSTGWLGFWCPCPQGLHTCKVGPFACSGAAVCFSIPPPFPTSHYLGNTAGHRVKNTSRHTYCLALELHLGI